jgi:hypothetical protein
MEATEKAAATLDPRRCAAWSGAITAALFAIGSLIWALDMPEDGTAATVVVDFYRDTADRIVVGGSLSLLAVAAFVFFVAALRRVLLDAGGSDVLATSAFGGAVLGMAAGIGAETINMAAALSAREGVLDHALARSLFEASQALGASATGVGMGVFSLAAGLDVLRTSVLPRWLALAMLVVGLVLLSPLAHVNWVAGAALVLITSAISFALFTQPASPSVRPQTSRSRDEQAAP